MNPVAGNWTKLLHRRPGIDICLDRDTGVGALIFFWHAGFYFEDATDHNRFIAWLLAFAGSMLLVVLSGNLLLTFVAWELTSVTSFMLIGFNGRNNAEAREGRLQGAVCHRRRRARADHWLGYPRRGLRSSTLSR